MLRMSAFRGCGGRAVHLISLYAIALAGTPPSLFFSQPIQSDLDHDGQIETFRVMKRVHIVCRDSACS
ncbi:TPA: hypothetical protein DCL30_04090 [Candidatus Peribacteria bacterium]|nr:MAG: hypothetical protein A3J91_04435 [Candidatus Peribacteria bacterium RIFOXYC2_FULL_58_10]OGJ83963.1 MAG: hypothetical protein A2529_04145 [Candidatus Peribacteria bacterium RIFOXYD2_FULL_58_15]HAI98685.1 hypothetical protein [Candidatus Peribacteria bacterium]HAS34398.1 hypothetical protein [Candidatus Peribacteria bacterium]